MSRNLPDQSAALLRAFHRAGSAPCPHLLVHGARFTICKPFTDFSDDSRRDTCCMSMPILRCDPADPCPHLQPLAASQWPGGHA